MNGHSMNESPCSECGDLDGCHLPAKIAQDRLSLSEFWDCLAEWSQATFGNDNVRGPSGPLKHLAKEVQEAIVKPDDLEEYADLLLLVFDSCRRAGFTFEDLRQASNVKLKVNRARIWGPPSASDEPIEHVRLVGAGLLMQE